jgi:predicted PurR-regulated permease PerM
VRPSDPGLLPDLDGDRTAGLFAPDIRVSADRALLWPVRIIALAAILMLAKAAKPIVIPIALAIVLALVLARPVDRMQRKWGIPLPLGASLALLSFFGLVTTAGLALLPPAKDWLAGTANAMHAFSDMLDRLRAVIPGLARALNANRAGSGPLSEKLAVQGLDVTGAMLAQGGEALLTIVATIILAFLFLISERWLVAQTVTLLPTRRQRVRLLGVLCESQEEVAHFFTTMSLINLVMGAITAATMYFIGLPNAVFWGAVVAVLNFIPYFGPMLLIALFLLAGVSTFQELPMMFAPMGAFIVINILESEVFSPWILGRRLRLNPLAIFFSVLLLGWLWGFVGAFLTVPFLIALRAIGRRLRSKRLFVFVARSTEASCSLRSLLGRDTHVCTTEDHYRSEARCNVRRQ